MDLEKLKKKRSAIRAVITRLKNKIETEIANEGDKNVFEEMVAQIISKGELILAYNGPKMCPDILELLLKFRQNRIAFTADIEQVFLQISLADEDRNAVKFLRNDGELNGTKTKALRMTRVTFGATSSLFLLRATFNVHADKYKFIFQYPNVFSMLTENMYVDDLLVGANEESELIKRILKEGGFNMWKKFTKGMELRRFFTRFDLF
ncbi:uncharacterized protein LOC118196744 [Stegodyphus dumicola]|uniref:uncharacterized protein LOC118196744 n=1 Tax=Stegodyphus dumicola TaxID=202533 RepID=UPI0015AE2B76|nr:uncharacterized protein LOC118196744 [Stegodyphus dumicola]